MSHIPSVPVVTMCPRYSGKEVDSFGSVSYHHAQFPLMVGNSKSHWISVALMNKHVLITLIIIVEMTPFRSPQYNIPYLLHETPQCLLTLGAHAQKGYGTWSVCVSVRFPVLPCRTFRHAMSGTSGFSGTMAVELKRRFS